MMRDPEFQKLGARLAPGCKSVISTPDSMTNLLLPFSLSSIDNL